MFPSPCRIAEVYHSRIYPMTETEFLEASAAVFDHIEAVLENGDVDCSINEGVMELELENGSKIIVNRHLPNREIWIAARQGGYHYRWQDNQWADTRGGVGLYANLAQCIVAQGGETVDFG